MPQQPQSDANTKIIPGRSPHEGPGIIPDPIPIVEGAKPTDLMWLVFKDAPHDEVPMVAKTNHDTFPPHTEKPRAINTLPFSNFDGYTPEVIHSPKAFRFIPDFWHHAPMSWRLSPRALAVLDALGLENEIERFPIRLIQRGRYPFEGFDRTYEIRPKKLGEPLVKVEESKELGAKDSAFWLETGVYPKVDTNAFFPTAVFNLATVNVVDIFRFAPASFNKNHETGKIYPNEYFSPWNKGLLFTDTVLRSLLAAKCTGLFPIPIVNGVTMISGFFFQRGAGWAVKRRDGVEWMTKARHRKLGERKTADDCVREEIADGTWLGGGWLPEN